MENVKHIVDKGERHIKFFASPIHIEECFLILIAFERLLSTRKDEPGVFRSNVGGYHSGKLFSS